MSILQRHSERDHSQRCTRVCGNRMCVVTLPRFALHRCQTSLVQGAHRGVQGCAAIGCASSPCLASLCTVVRPRLCKALTEVYKGVRQSDVHRHPASLRFAPLSDLTCARHSQRCTRVCGNRMCVVTLPRFALHRCQTSLVQGAHRGVQGCAAIGCASSPCLASLCTVVRPHLCKALAEVYKGVRQSDVHRHPASLRFCTVVRPHLCNVTITMPTRHIVTCHCLWCTCVHTHLPTTHPLTSHHITLHPVCSCRDWWLRQN
jgi:hypothetical protein